MLEETHQRWQAVETVHDIVSAMRAIAAGRIQSAQRTLAAARHYEDVVRRGLSALPPEALALPDRSRELPAALVVMMSEQPFCGAFNQNLLPTVERRQHELSQESRVQVFVVGQRGCNLISSAGIVAEGTLPAAASLHGLLDLVKRLASLVVTQYAQQKIRELRVIYNRYRSLTEHVPTEVRVLPPDLSSLRAATNRERPAFRYLSETDLVAGFVSELAFVHLYRAAAESFASEQAARLVAMDGATRNTERLAKGLLDLERRERQGEITRQVLELITGRLAVE